MKNSVENYREIKRNDCKTCLKLILKVKTSNKMKTTATVTTAVGREVTTL